MIKTYRTVEFGGDPLDWEFVKYAIYTTHLLIYENQPQFLKFIYPYNYQFNNDLIQYYRELFNFVDEFECYLSNEIKTTNYIEDYIEKQSKSENDYIYLNNSVVPTKAFNINPNRVYFLRDHGSETRFSKIYTEMGIFDGIFDDRIIFVPKSICKPILNGIENIRQNYNFNDKTLANLTQFVIQTHAILNNISIEILNCPVIEKNLELCLFFSNKAYSPSFSKG